MSVSLTKIDVAPAVTDAWQIRRSLPVSNAAKDIASRIQIPNGTRIKIGRISQRQHCGRIISRGTMRPLSEVFAERYAFACFLFRRVTIRAPPMTLERDTSSELDGAKIDATVSSVAIVELTKPQPETAFWTKFIF